MNTSGPFTINSAVRFAVLLSSLLVLHATPRVSAEEGRWRLHYSQPAERWIEALPVGNGRMGAMVFGGAAEARFQLNEDSVWTGQPHDYSHQGAVEHLAEIRRLLFSGEQKAAESLASSRFMSVPLRQQQYQPLGDLKLRLDHPEGEISDYHRSLDLERAVATTTYSAGGVKYQRKTIASHPDQSIVVHLTCEKPGALSFEVEITSPHERTGTTATDGKTLKLFGQVNEHERNIPDVPSSEVRFTSFVRISSTDGDVAVVGEGKAARLRVSGGSMATLVVTAATSVVSAWDNSGDPAPPAERDLQAATEKSTEQLFKRHTADYQSLFNRVSFVLSEPSREALDLDTDDRLLAAAEAPDTDLAALLLHYGRYLMIASSRPGGQPANLQGLWNQDLGPAWGSKYTANINAEMNYWLTETCDLGECNEPLFDAIKELAESGRKTAAVHYGAPGWVLHHNFDRWRGTAPINASNHGIWPTGGAWLCQHLWWRYEYSGDEDYLRDVAYPLMKGASEFFLHYLVEDPRTDKGWLISGPSNSPEQGGLVMGPTMDHQIIRNLFENTIAAAEVLGEDPEFCEALRSIHSRIAPNQIGQHGQLQEWLEDRDDINSRHRHVSHLWGLYPGREITPESPDLFAAARKSLEIRGDGGTGWSRAWKVNFWARLLDGDRALRVLDGLMTLTDSDKTKYSGGGLYTNLFDAHPPFQIDGNFGATAGIVEMLVQSHRKTEEGVRRIDLLPALPTAWDEGALRGVRTRDGFVLEIEWDNGALKSCGVRATLDAPVVLTYGEEQVRLDLKAGEAALLSGGLELAN